MVLTVLAVSKVAPTPRRYGDRRLANQVSRRIQASDCTNTRSPGNSWKFVAASSLTRGIRFFGVTAIVKRFGPGLLPVIERRLALAAGLVEVRRIQPTLEPVPDRRPVAVDDREPGRVPVAAPVHRRLPEHPLERQPQALRRRPQCHAERLSVRLRSFRCCPQMLADRREITGEFL